MAASEVSLTSKRDDNPPISAAHRDSSLGASTLPLELMRGYVGAPMLLLVVPCLSGCVYLDEVAVGGVSTMGER